MLFEESAIAPEIAAARGYRTVTRAGVPPEFKAYQRRAGLLMPCYSPDGVTGLRQLRPNSPRRGKNGKPRKYEMPGGGRIAADVNPAMLRAARDPDTPLWITEGIRKGDALASRGRAAVALIGVWGWKRDGEMLPCFDHVPLRGRRVYVVPDTDVHANPNVSQAFDWLAAALAGRGAEVLMVYQPGAPEAKLGVDDYLAAGGTVEYLEELAEPYRPERAAEERLSRSERLRRQLGALWSGWSAADWRGTGGHTRRELVRAMLEDAARRGESTPEGIRGTLSQRQLAEAIGTGQQTIWRNMHRLEHAGVLRLEKREGKPPSYVLLTPGGEGRARVSHQGRAEGKPGERRERGAGQNPADRTKYDPTDSPTRGLDEIKRLRWSYCERIWTPGGYEYQYRERVGKIAGRVLEALIDLGGHAGVHELAAAIGHARPRDLRRRPLAKLARWGLVTLDGDGAHLARDWPEKLGLARELGEEYAAEERTRRRHAAARVAYRHYRERGETYTREELREMRRENARTRREAAAPRRPTVADKIERLAGQGMAERFAREDVLGRLGFDGFASELERLEERVEPGPGLEAHPLDCECLDCAARAPCYVSGA